jgi:hypothetical protein
MSGRDANQRFVYPGQGMSILADSLWSQTPGAVPMIFDVGPSYNECIIAPSGSGMSGQSDKLAK